MVKYLEGNIVGVPEVSPLAQNPIIFLNTYTGTGATRNTWTKVDMTGIVPSGTKAIRLDGILIITHGTTSETADLMVHFRKPNETYEYNYIMQTIEASTLNGQRSNAGTWIALDENMCFEYKWNSQTLGQYPTYSAYGLNLTLTAYMRNEQTNISALLERLSVLESRVEELSSRTYSEDTRVSSFIELAKTM